MKNKTFKLLLVLGVIILSLFSFFSCEETNSEPPEYNKIYKREIKDEEYIEFVINNFYESALYDIDIPYTLVDFYKDYLKNPDVLIKEYKLI